MLGLDGFFLLSSKRNIEWIHGGRKQVWLCSCGKKLESDKTGRPASFCSSNCRLKFWMARKKEERQHSSKSIFTSRVVYGCCGGFYGSKVWHSSDKYRTVIWQCNSKFSKEMKCTTPQLKEGKIKEIYLKALNQLITDKEPSLEVMRRMLEKVSDTASLEDEVGKAERSLDEVVILFQDYISKNAITEADLTDGKYMELETKYNRSMEKVESLRAELTSRMRRAASIEGSSRR